MTQPHHEAKFVLGAARWQDLPAAGLPEVAFIGRSNVGKSSLLNALLGRRELARTSGTPGKTQQFNYYLVDDRLYFVDLPGYGYAKISKTERDRWVQFIGQYLSEREPLRLVCHLVDGRHPPMAQDLEITEFMRGSTVPYLVLLTKTDKLSGNERARSLAAARKAFAGRQVEPTLILTSAHDHRGHEDVWEWIETLTRGSE